LNKGEREDRTRKRENGGNTDRKKEKRMEQGERITLEIKR
jgi:hypothetical protein